MDDKSTYFLTFNKIESVPDKTDEMQPNQRGPALMIGISDFLFAKIWKESFFHNSDAQGKQQLLQISSPKPA